MKLYPLILTLCGIFLLAACGVGNPYQPMPEANPGDTAVVTTAQPSITAWPTNVTATQKPSLTPLPPVATPPDQPNGSFFQGAGPGAANLQRAAELPQTPADVEGIFDHRQDNKIFVGTGGMTTIVQPGGAPQTSYDGPAVEVIVTNETKIYQDVTMNQFSGPPPEGQQIQQVVQSGSLEEIGQGSMLTVWGTRSGDQITASVLVYALPNTITQ